MCRHPKCRQNVENDPKYNMYVYRVVRLNFKQEIEILCVLFDRALSIFTMTSIKKYIE